MPHSDRRSDVALEAPTMSGSPRPARGWWRGRRRRRRCRCWGTCWRSGAGRVAEDDRDAMAGPFKGNPQLWGIVVSWVVLRSSCQFRVSFISMSCQLIGALSMEAVRAGLTDQTASHSPPNSQCGPQQRPRNRFSLFKCALSRRSET